MNSSILLLFKNTVIEYLLNNETLETHDTSDFFKYISDRLGIYDTQKLRNYVLDLVSDGVLKYERIINKTTPNAAKHLTGYSKYSLTDKAKTDNIVKVLKEFTLFVKIEFKGKVQVIEKTNPIFKNAKKIVYCDK